MARFVLESILKLRDDLSRPVTRAFERIENVGDRVARRIGGRLRSAFSLRNVALAGAAGVGAIGGGLTYIAKKAHDAALKLDAINDEAKALKVSPEFLSAIRQAAAEAGKIDVETIGNSFARFLAQLEELRAGRGQLDSFLGDIGAGAFKKQLQEAENSTDALRLAFQAIAQETDASKQIKLAELFFGGRGRDLRRLAQDGAWDQLQARYSELAGATQEQFDTATELADAEDKLGTLIRRLSLQLGAKLAPAFRDVVRGASAWLQANQDLVNQRIGDFADWVGERLQALANVDWASWFSAAGEVIADVIDVLKTFGKIAAGIGGAALAVIKSLTKGLRALGIDGKALVRVGQLFFAVWAVAKIAALGHSVYGLAQRFGGFVRGIRQLPDGARRAKMAMGAMLTGGIGLAVTLASAIGDIVSGLRGVREESKRSEVQFDVAGLETPIVEALNAQREQLQKDRAELAELTRGIGGKFRHDRPVLKLRDKIAQGEQAVADLERQEKTAKFLGETLLGDAKTELANQLRLGLELALRGKGDSPEARRFFAEAARQGLDEALLEKTIEAEKRRRSAASATDARLAREDSTGERPTNRGGVGAIVTGAADRALEAELRRATERQARAAEQFAAAVDQFRQLATFRSLDVGRR